MRILRDQHGQVVILTGLCMTCLLLFLAFAVDIGSFLYQKRRIQTAADCASVAGAEEINYASIDNTTVQAAAWGAAAQNGFDHDASGTTVTVNNGPVNGPHAGNSGYVEVIVEQTVPTFFMKLLQLNSITVSARSVAGFGGSQGCVYTLGTSGTDLSDSGPGTVSMPNCDIFVNSSSGTAATISNSSITSKAIGIVGGYSGTGFSPAPTTGIAPVTDPLAYLQEPTIPGSCSTSVNFSGGTQSLNPGCYSKLQVSGSTTLNLSPGLYIINGDISFSISSGGSVNGSGVTFYTTGQTSVSNSTLNISAPTSGTWNGILFFQSRTDSKTFSFSGASNSNMQGIIYAPDAQLKFTDGSASVYAAIVTSQLTLTGPATLNSYALENAGNPLATVSLVE